MSSLSRLTTWGVAAIAAVALPATAVVYYYFGGLHAGAFLYGVGVGMIVFTAIALTVSLISGKTTSLRMLLGAMIYVGRLGFAVVAIGAPVLVAGWPIASIFGGFVVVYVVENIAVLVVLGRTKVSGNRWRNEDVKRRIEV